MRRGDGSRRPILRAKLDAILADGDRPGLRLAPGTLCAGAQRLCGGALPDADARIGELGCPGCQSSRIGARSHYPLAAPAHARGARHICDHHRHHAALSYSRSVVRTWRHGRSTSRTAQFLSIFGLDQRCPARIKDDFIPARNNARPTVPTCLTIRRAYATPGEDDSTK